jgi:drug/metabolite transporter (DMT)-like permease
MTTTDRRTAFTALTVAGLLWGTTVPVSKAALQWLPPGWLTVARFGLAALVLLVAARSRLRAALTPAILVSGAAGYGGSVLVQNAGIIRTSVSHAALLIGASPVLIAVIAALWHRTVARPAAWAGFVLSLAGVGLIVGGRAAGASLSGDLLVLVAVLISAAVTVAQTRLLAGRDPVAVTAVQFLGASIAVLPVAAVTEGLPAVPGSPAALAAIAGLALGGTLVPFTLFAYAQVRVPAEVAGAFYNLEPLVGALAGVVVFGNPVGPQQLAGGAAILAGIALSSLPLLAARRPRRSGTLATARVGPPRPERAAARVGPPRPERAAARVGPPRPERAAARVGPLRPERAPAAGAVAEPRQVAPVHQGVRRGRAGEPHHGPEADRQRPRVQYRPRVIEPGPPRGVDHDVEAVGGGLRRCA